VDVSLNERIALLKMSLITIIWSMIASASLTLAAFQFLVWGRNREAWANLFFSLMAIGTAAFTFCELGMMRAETPKEFGNVLRWGHVPTWLIVVSLISFVRFYLKAGQPWLAWLICGLRTLALILNFLVGQNLNYREITRLQDVSFLGESVHIAEGVPNPWMLVGQISFLFLIAFLADASVTTWRRGDHHRAVAVGSSAVFFMLFSVAQSVLVFWGIVRTPFVASVSFMGLVLVMGYELSSDTLRASQLTRKLQESEAGLHEIEERMRLAVEGTNFGIWIQDLARNEVWATAKWREVFGFAERERLDIDKVFQRIHFEDRDAFRLVLEKAATGAGSYETEYRVVLPRGDVRWIGSRGRVEFDGAKKPILVRSVSNDITEQKEAEDESQNLRRQVAHVGRVSMMGQLASSLAHEINQPLGAILRNAEAAELLMQDKSPDLDEIRAILADIQKDDHRAGSVIDRMRGLLKRQNLDKRPVDVADLVGGVADLVRSDAAARHIRLELAVPLHLPPVFGDLVHLQQVLLNLIVNGMDAVDGAKGGRRVSVAAALDGSKAIEIAVSDSGPGVPADQLAHIFDPFFTTKPNGMGMGLAISRTIIETHNGRLWAENREKGGASFRFTLPISDKEVPI
jgi:two-component system, LuxR family, sensor kinase FixL